MDSGGGPGNKETLLFTKPAASGHPHLEAVNERVQ